MDKNRQGEELEDEEIQVQGPEIGWDEYLWENSAKITKAGAGK